MYKIVTHKTFVTLNSSRKHKIDSTLLYRGLLGHHTPCYNANTWPRFLITLKSFLSNWSNCSSFRWSFWFSLKASKAQWTTAWKTRPLFSMQILARIFLQRDFLKIWSVKSTTYSLKCNLIVCNLLFNNSSVSYFLRH